MQSIQPWDRGFDYLMAMVKMNSVGERETEVWVY